jgi:large exoprotein involved in heme utilization and adhesion
VTVTVSKQLLLQNSFVTTEATQADGGDITLRVQDLIRLRDSQITTAVRSGEGAGGNIVLDTAAEFVVLQNSQIVANAFGGPGGNISIRTGVFLTDPGSQVSASSALGIDGQIDIQAPVTNLSGVVAPLSPDFAQATALLRDRCAARLREGTVSSLVVRARPSLPATYDGLLPGRLYEPKRQQATPAGVAHQPQKPSVTQQGHLRIDSVGGVHSMIKFFVLDGLLR